VKEEEGKDVVAE